MKHGYVIIMNKLNIIFWFILNNKSILDNNKQELAIMSSYCHKNPYDHIVSSMRPKVKTKTLNNFRQDISFWMTK